MRRRCRGQEVNHLEREDLMAETTPETQAVRIKTDPDPYDQFNIALGYRVGNLVTISGQAAIDENGQVVGVGNFDAQAEQVFKNLQRVLEAAGSGLDKIVKVNIYLTDMSNFPKIVDLRSRYFKRPWPADTIVGVTALALPELMIEIEATALVDGELVG
jgi:2-iminobutanoate/2-iminopropanoate deaminase